MIRAVMVAMYTALNLVLHLRDSRQYSVIQASPEVSEFAGSTGTAIVDAGKPMLQGNLFMKKLNARDQLFVDEYLLDLDPKRAAIAAGYSETTAATKAYQWVANGGAKPNVFAAIVEAKAKRSERTEIKQDWVLQTLVETIDRCRQSAPVVDKDGSPVFVELPSGEVAPAYQFAPAAVLRGLELAGKHLGMFKDRLDITGGMAHEEALAQLEGDEPVPVK